MLSGPLVTKLGPQQLLFGSSSVSSQRHDACPKDRHCAPPADGPCVLAELPEASVQLDDGSEG